MLLGFARPAMKHCMGLGKYVLRTLPQFETITTLKSTRHYSMEQRNTMKSIQPLDDTQKMQKILTLEMDVLRQEGHRVPTVSFLNQDHWHEMLELKSKSARRKFYAYLWLIERKKEKKTMRKGREDAIERKKLQLQVDSENQHIVYGLSHTTFLLRIYDTTINLWDNNRLIQAIRWGPKIVVDCSYDQYMTKRESVNAAKQLMLSFAINRSHIQPFDIHFCNINNRGTVMTYFEKHVPTLREPWFPLNLHEKCFTELFPKERIVYLTPHCKEDLHTFNHDDVYIIGCMVDKINNEPLSLAKAKKLGVRMARLPLDKFLHWKSGSGKSLTINQVVAILLEVKQENDWKSAFRHVPNRKRFSVN